MEDVIFFQIINNISGIVTETEEQLTTNNNLFTDFTNTSLSTITSDNYNPDNTSQQEQLQDIILQYQQIFSLQKRSIQYIESEIKEIKKLFEFVDNYIVIHGDTIIPKDVIESYNYILNYSQYQQHISNIKSKLKETVGLEYVLTPYDTCSTLVPFNFPILQEDKQTIRYKYLYRPKIIMTPYSFEDIQTIITKKPDCFQGKSVTSTHYYFTKETIVAVLAIIERQLLTISKLNKQYRYISQQSSFITNSFI